MKLTLNIRPVVICCDDCGVLLVTRPEYEGSSEYRCGVCEEKFLDWVSLGDESDEIPDDSEGSSK